MVPGTCCRLLLLATTPSTATGKDALSCSCSFPSGKTSSWQVRTPYALEREEGTTRRNVPFHFGKSLQERCITRERDQSPPAHHKRARKYSSPPEVSQRAPSTSSTQSNVVQSCPTTSTAEPQSRRAASPVDGTMAAREAPSLVYIQRPSCLVGSPARSCWPPVLDYWLPRPWIDI